MSLIVSPRNGFCTTIPIFLRGHGAVFQKEVGHCICYWALRDGVDLCPCTLHSAALGSVCLARYSRQTCELDGINMNAFFYTGVFQDFREIFFTTAKSIFNLNWAFLCLYRSNADSWWSHAEPGSLRDAPATHQCEAPCFKPYLFPHPKEPGCLHQELLRERIHQELHERLCSFI